MAHRKKIPACSCGRPSTHEVFGSRNEPYGPRCERCSARLVRDLSEREQAPPVLEREG